MIRLTEEEREWLCGCLTREYHKHLRDINGDTDGYSPTPKLTDWHKKEMAMIRTIYDKVKGHKKDIEEMISIT